MSCASTPRRRALPGGLEPGQRVKHAFSGEVGTVLEPRAGSEHVRVDFGDVGEAWEGFPKHLERMEATHVRFR